MNTATVRRSSKSSTKSKGLSHANVAARPGRGAKGLSGYFTRSLSRPFNAIRKKVTKTISGNGDEYLHDAVNKITKTTSQVVKWSKKNPLKLAGGVAALTAVSAFLVHTMKSK